MLRFLKQAISIHNIVLNGGSEMRRIISTLAIGTLLSTAGSAFAVAQTPAQNPTTGHRGAPTNTCGSMSPPALPNQTPGNAVNATGSAFNPNGTAGLHYAGNPNTASLANSNSTAAVAQYDVACFQVP
jgi:hypothetical protein